MTDLKRLDNIGIAVQDLAHAYAFNHDVLGLSAEPPRLEAEGFAAQLGDVALYILKTDSTDGLDRTADLPKNPLGLDHLAFEVEDFEAAQRNLEGQDITFIHAVVGEPGGFRYRGFHDPDGNVIYIIDRGG